ncbi:rab-like protein 6 isoform X1 [Astyanax mexicanus]|uniref:rab-like protein 6 isoform X1 n=1 Tax=Astyanax mexicanus TaxID=7994 RepID=UPI0020CB6690|nr:rab-like protein 6 isoform X1 [Astyanax mexicanus]XP_022523471.2 rab-like protein 6 isoform X1 [Astyanax mexicanus]
MFTALKKLVGSEAGQFRDRNIPAGLQSMNQSLQRRFAKGVQYNMKIVIRGDRNTGKSALWHRLQGKKFIEEYIPTQEIQVTSIHWNYKTTDDVVKVEVWDVVDKGKGKKRGENLKLENEPQESETEMALDAEFLDVYKNCNGVIMMFDITKQWTFNYIMRELPKVPTHVPVCVLGNQRDMGEHRVILPDDIRDFINNLNRPPGSSYIHYAESSMKNGFGLKYLHRFFNIPFLQLQRETLLRQLETNQLDIDATLEELNVQQETEDQNYDIFIDMMEARKAYGSPAPSNSQSPSSGSQSPIVLPGAASPSNSSPSTPQAPLPMPPQPQLQPHPDSHPVQPPVQSPAPPVPKSQPPLQSIEPPVSPQAAQAAPPAQKRGFISRLFGSATPETPPDKPETAACETPKPSSGKVQNVDDFVPEVGLDRGFLEDSGEAAKSKKKTPAAAPNQDSDSDGEGRGGNPLVSGFQDDLDPDDQAASQPRNKAAAPSSGITLTSDEEDERQPASTAAQNKDFCTSIDTKGSTVNSSKEQWSKPKPAERPHSLKTVSHSPVQQHTRKPGGAVEAQSSDSEEDGQKAQQILSFVMDDPDFEGTDLGIPTTKKQSFAGRDDLSEKSDDGFVLAGFADPPKINPSPFKSLNSDIDLFDLGFEESTPKSKDSSEDQEEDSRSVTKDKKKKKKKDKEEDERSSKKRHKHKKKEKEESGTVDEKEKKKKKSKSKKSGNVDDLEAFLSGGKSEGGGDYEEL